MTFHSHTTHGCLKILAASVSLTVFAIPASAQMVLEEIVVTAQKRAESMQDVPVAISAFSSERLERSGISSTSDLSIVTPGLQMGNQIASSTPYLRGVGTQNSGAGDESSIATYVDGVYSNSMIANVMELVNIERIEVLKGPQGTLFGRNATGGLIHVITRDPEFDTAAKIQTSYGSYATQGVKLYATTGLTDTIAADIALSYSNQGDGYGTNLVTGHDRGYTDHKIARGKILFEISEDTSAKLAWSYAETESDAGISWQPAKGTLGLDGSSYTGDWQDVANTVDSYYSSRIKGLSLHLEHSFAAADFLSITAYQEQDTQQLFDQDGVAFDVVTGYIPITSDIFTQEFQLSSNNGGNLHWITGLFYMDSAAGFDPFNLTGFAVPGIIPGAIEIDNHPDQDSTSYSAYLQGDYAVTDNTKVTLGLRITRDEREAHAYASADFGGGFVVLDQGTVKESWSEPTWRLAIDHQLNDNTLLFASYSRGFKSGVFNTTTLSSVSEPVDPETLDAYEVGIKTDLLDNSLRLNASLFYYDYQDMQLSRISNGATQLVNAASAEIYGAEAEVTWIVSNNLSINMGLSLLDSEYSDFPDAAITTPTGFGGNILATDPSGKGASGNNLIRSPEYAYNIGLLYDLPTDSGNYSASLLYSYNDGFYWEPDNRIEQESYTIVNINLGWVSPDQQWQVDLYGKNLLDEEYSIFSASIEPGDMVASAAPRTYGISLSYSF